MEADSTKDPQKDVTDFTSKISCHIAMAKLVTKDGQQQHDFIQRGLGHLIEQDGIVSTVLRDIRQVIHKENANEVRESNGSSANGAQRKGAIL